MTEFQFLANYLATIFNGYLKKETNEDNIKKINDILQSVFPEKSTELQTQFENKFPELYNI